MATLSNATLKLWVYQDFIGNYDTNNPNYTITKTKLNSEDDILFEISELAKDYIPIEFDGDYGSANITAWVSFEVTYNFDDSSVSVKKGDLLATHGYGYFEDEINPQLTSPLQQSNTCVYWRSGEKVRIPLYSGLELYDVEWFIDSTSQGKQSFGNNITPITADTTNYRADNVSLIKADTTHIDNIDENDYSKNVYAPNVSVNRAVVTTRDNQQVELTITYINECKNTPYKVTFLNKFGVLQDIWFFGRRKESANVTREQFRINTVQPSSTGSYYKTSSSTDKIHNIESKKSLVLNTGFICEDYNEVVQQMMQSEYVWIHENNKVYPVTPSDNTIDYKDRRYDKLLNFTVRFDYAFSELNSVR